MFTWLHHQLSLQPHYWNFELHQVGEKENCYSLHLITWGCLLLKLQEGFAFAHCTTCKAPYHLRVHAVADRKWRTMKFRFFVTRDIIFIFLAVQFVSFICFLFNLLPNQFMYPSRLHLCYNIYSFIYLHAGNCFSGIFDVFYRWFSTLLASSYLGFQQLN